MADICVLIIYSINIFLDGHIPTENLRFREESLQFRIGEAGEEFLSDQSRDFSYPKMQKTLGGFNLTIESGSFTNSEIIVMMGENGTGKTTYVYSKHDILGIINAINLVSVACLLALRNQMAR